MCDYCDCRLQPEIAVLSEQHEELLSLLAQLRRNHAAGMPVDDVLGEVASVLVPHARREEDGVFARLRSAGTDGGYVGRFEDDHAAIHGLLETGDAIALADLLQEHIFREETDLFPAARQILTPADWDAVDASQRVDATKEHP